MADPFIKVARARLTWSQCGSRRYELYSTCYSTTANWDLLKSIHHITLRNKFGTSDYETSSYLCSLTLRINIKTPVFKANQERRKLISFGDSNFGDGVLLIKTATGFGNSFTDTAVCSIHLTYPIALK